MHYFLPLLGLLFIGLKLGGVIAWSWLWVLSPFWGGLLLWLLVFGVVLGAAWLQWRGPIRFK